MSELPQLVPQNVCLSCDGCCRFEGAQSMLRPKMTPEEVAEFRRGGLETPGESFLKELDAQNYIKTVASQGQRQCTFFRFRDHICDIYEYRPFECQLYPFLLIKQEDQAAVGVHLSCPYVQEKRHKAEFEAHTKQLKQYFQQRSVLEFIRRNPSILGDYSGYQEEIESIFELAL